ncbi:MAG: PEP-CTERM sorting domain-containing protein [Candidatus Acidiferrales bacterium]
MKARLLFGMLATLLVAVAPASADSIGVFGTGLTTTGALGAPGAVDPHYTLTTNPAGGGTSAFVTTGSGFPFPPWVPNGPNSQWITPNTSQLNHPAGTYTYVTTFDLTGLIPGTAVLTGAWGTDNPGQMFLNGVLVSTSSGFTSLTAFLISSGFLPGVNTLTFVIENLPQATGNPSGLRVDISGTASPVPEPSTLLLLGSGMAGLWLRRRLRA